MMTISHLLEDFSVLPEETEASKLMSEDGLEDIRLASFEQGYTAGWDDAIRAQAEDQTRVTGVLGKNLEDLSFTYQEALVQMTSSVEPVFRSLVEAVLPEVMMQTVGLQLVEQLQEMTADRLDQPVVLVVPVGTGKAISAAVQRNLAMQVEVRENASMEAGQVSLKVGSTEREVDTEKLLASLQESIESFFYSINEAKKYG